MNAPLACPGLFVSTAAPAARMFRRADGLGIAWGLASEDLRQLQGATCPLASVAEDACSRRGDASVVFVGLSGDRPVAIFAWRGLTSCHEVFFAVTDGTVIVSDHMRNILAALPTGRRNPSPEALADHFIFRTIPGRQTLSAAVARLGRGERLEISPGGGAVRRATFERADDPMVHASQRHHVDRLAHALDQALAPLAGAEGVANLFSGGVDSTLIQSHLGRNVPALHYILPMFRREFERAYADRAAGHLGVPLHQVETSAEDYAERLVRTVRLMGMPPPHIQFCFYEALFRLPHDTFVIGEQGDALFGLSVRKVKAASHAATPGRIRFLEAVAPLVPRSRRRRFRLLFATARRLLVDPADPGGYASRMGVYCDESMLAALFGPEMLAQRLEARHRELHRMARPAAPVADRFLRHVETAQLLDYLTEDMMTCYRHLAHGLGKSVVSPFLDRGVFDAAMKVPPAMRYVRGLQGKHMLKAVLRRRVPAYPVNQRKGYSGIELAALHPGGPLSAVWERYRVPGIFDKRLRPSILDGSGPMTWNAITLAVWQKEIAENPHLRPLPGSRVLAWPSALEARHQPIPGGSGSDD